MKATHARFLQFIASMTHQRRLSPPVRLCFFVLLLFTLLFSAIKPALASIVLSSFSATPQANSVQIDWETQTEFDIAGFYLLRRTSEFSGYSAITDLIPAQGSGITGASYAFIDSDVTAGVIYYHRLQAMSVDQSYQEFGPVSAVLASDRIFLPLTIK